MAEVFSDANVQFVLRSLRRLGARPSDAEDLAQEVFVIAHRRSPEYDGTLRPEPWLYGIARNVLRGHRKLARHRHESLAGHVPEAATAGASSDGDLLRRALATLPEPLVDAIILCDLSELTVLETAAALGIPEGTLKDRLRKGRAALREELDRRLAEVRDV